MKIAVIPARGGSKRIPRKNIKSFNGKPIISYSIEAALKTELFDHVIVSTDDEEIASIAKEAGAEIPYIRPASLADDFTGTNDVVKHAIRWYGDNDTEISYACCIYATAPLLEASYIIDGFKQLSTSDSSFAFSVTHFDFPIQRALRINDDGRLQAISPDQISKRSQDLEESYHDAGQFYWGRAQAFLEDIDMMSLYSTPVVLPRYLVQDIDTDEDWKQAELMHQALQLATKQ